MGRGGSVATEGQISDFRRYQIYEASVQDVAGQCDLLEQFYEDQFGHKPVSLREDFCGTFISAIHWVKRGKERRAVGIDLDPVPLEFGRRHHLKSLTAGERKRLKVVLGDVRRVSSPKVDIATAGNFSFFCLRNRADLIAYFRAVHRGLNRKGALALEMAGGPGFVEAPYSERRLIKRPHPSGHGKPWFTYIWEQKKFDPISREGLYQISARMKSGQKYTGLFQYHWRVWTIPEVRECLAEAGFSSSQVYWPDQLAASSYSRVSQAENTDLETWLSFVVGYR